MAYTDGLCDTTDPRGDEWGWQRLVRYITEAVDRPVRDIVEGVIETVEAFSAGRRFDDITLWIGRARDESSLDTSRRRGRHRRLPSWRWPPRPNRGEIRALSPNAKIEA